MPKVHFNTKEAIRFAEDLNQQRKLLCDSIKVTNKGFDTLAKTWTDVQIQPFKEHYLEAIKMLQDFADKSDRYAQHLREAAIWLDKEFKVKF